MRRPPVASGTAASAASAAAGNSRRLRSRHATAAFRRAQLSWRFEHAWPGKYRARASTVAVQLFPQSTATGPLLYMSLESKQDHRLPAQLAARLAQRIETHALRPGTRLPSIRHCAQESSVSRSTVVEAYDRLIAAGLVESRRGSGFYVRLRANKLAQRRRHAHGAHSLPGTVLDVSWLL